MGKLTPGATLIYERVAGTIFAREFGNTERKVVGYITDSNPELMAYKSQINDVLIACERDPAMRDLLDQLFVLYNLKKNNDQTIL